MTIFDAWQTAGLVATFVLDVVVEIASDGFDQEYLWGDGLSFSLHIGQVATVILVDVELN